MAAILVFNLGGSGAARGAGKDADVMVETQSSGNNDFTIGEEKVNI